MKRLFFFYILLLLFGSGNLSAQLSNVDLCRPDVFRYANKLYVFGYLEKDGELFFQLQRLSPDLKTEKDISISLGKRKCADYYSIHSDTLHNYLNFVLQESNNDKTCMVLRFDKNLKAIAEINDAEIARVNTFTAYEKEFYYYKNELYVVRPLSRDSAHKFILQQYNIKDSSKVFEYVAGWQLNFAKQQYHRCKIIRVDDEYVYMFINVLSGTKKGQWIQYVNKASGEITYSVKLNKEEDGYTYLYAAHYYDTDNKQLHVTGYKFQNKSITEGYTKVDYPSGKIKPVPVFVCSVDSTGELISLTENGVLPPPDIEREKEFRQYVLKVNKFNYQSGKYNFLFDVIGSTNGTLYKTYGYAFCSLENDTESGTAKPKPGVFNCTYRDSKIKEAKFIFNTYEMDAKNNAEEILYKPAVSSSFKLFSWEPGYTDNKVNMVSVFSNKKETVIFRYQLAEGKWKNTEVNRAEVKEFTKVFSFDPEQILIFKNTTYDPETKIIKGFTASLIK